MPLQIIRQDITKMQTDAIVNPSNPYLLPTGGTDFEIHKAAGEELFYECRRLGGCAVGEAKITPAFKLPCKYVIHTAGPVWGEDSEPEGLLRSCYESCLKKAREYGCESIAFPLISAGTYGYPKDRVLKIAMNTISSFLFENEMSVFLLVYDKEAYELSEKLFSGIKSYIDDNYVFDRYEAEESVLLSEPMPVCDAVIEEERCATCISAPEKKKRLRKNDVSERTFAAKRKSLDEYIRLDESFSLKLLRLIDEKGMSDVECYKKANVSKQTWHKLMTDKSYKPGKKTAISFAVALRLTLDEAQSLLASVGFVLSDSSLFDVIIKYCLENEVYDVFEIDAALFKYDQETLFSKA